MSVILRAAAASNLGLARETNEDAVHVGERLVAVADGVGGLPAGELASDIAVRSLAALDTAAPGGGGPLGALRDAVAAASARIRETVEANPAVEGMSTTLTAMLVADDELAIVHIGDSRGYLWRSGKLTLLTRDDTYVQGLVDQGVISLEQARVHPHRSLVTQVLQGKEASPAYTLQKPHDGDRYLLCSDGLTDAVPDEVIARTLRDESDRHECAERLVQLALDAGGPDNVTVVVADVVVADVTVPT